MVKHCPSKGGISGRSVAGSTVELFQNEWNDVCLSVSGRLSVPLLGRLSKLFISCLSSAVVDAASCLLSRGAHVCAR